MSRGGNNNITQGFNNLQQQTKDFGESLNRPGDADILSQRLDEIADLSISGKNRGLGIWNQQLASTFKGDERFHINEMRRYSVGMSRTREKLSDLKKELTYAKEAESIASKSKNIDAEAVEQSKEKVRQIRTQINSQERLLRDQRAARENVRQELYDKREIYEQTKNTAREVHNQVKLEDARRRETIRHHITESRSASRLLRNYGRGKIELGLQNFAGVGDAEGSLGEAVGGLAVGGLAIIGAKLLEEVFKGLSANVRRTIQTSDIYRGTSKDIAPNDFRNQILYGNIYNQTALTPQEGLEVANVLRQRAGSRIQNMPAALNYTAALDRFTGAQIGTFANTYGYLARQTGMTTNAGGSQQFAIEFSEAIGKGKLAGLQEETLAGIQQLVELTRRQTLNGPDANGFLRLIANLSSTGKTQLIGQNAADVLSNMNAAIQNPGTQFYQAIVSSGIASVLRNKKIMGKSATSATPLDILALESEGLGASFKGKDIGAFLPYAVTEAAVKRLSPNSGKLSGQNLELAALVMQRFFGSVPVGEYLMSHPGVLPGNTDGAGLLSTYGVNQDVARSLLTSPGSFAFLADLARGDQQYKGQKNRHEKALRYAVTQASSQFPEFKDKFDSILASSSPINQKVLEALKLRGQTGTEPADKLRMAEVALKNSVEKGMSGITDKISDVLGFLTMRFGNHLGTPTSAKNIGAEIKTGKFRFLSNGVDFSLPWMKGGKRDLSSFGGADMDYIDREARAWANSHPTTGSSFNAYKGEIYKAATNTGVPPWLLASVIQAESGFNPWATNFNYDKNGKITSVDFGLGQVNSRTAESMGVAKNQLPTLYGVSKNIALSAKILAENYKRDHGDLIRTIGDYNGRLEAPKLSDFHGNLLAYNTALARYHTETARQSIYISSILGRRNDYGFGVFGKVPPQTLSQTGNATHTTNSSPQRVEVTVKHVMHDSSGRPVDSALNKILTDPRFTSLPSRSETTLTYTK